MLHRAQRIHGALDQVDVAGLARLECFDRSLESLGDLDADCSMVPIDVLPAHGNGFFRPHSRRKHELEIGDDSRIVLLCHVRQHGLHLFGAQRIWGRLLVLGVVDAAHGVVQLRPVAAEQFK
ncbi:MULTISPECIES: hypothetical protein [unclassified Herbaspirillum]|uniref:hypothetical protein n=1 Tax=unclassified Herbaspirillum TaxID=2624150 RepID=UPI000E2F702B|nr:MULTISPECIES: hypothetical protein [unclassified Herbaspirillum]RFB73847.1 hypothetical protein DZB54_06130 [Herbaspirillum sp. 3R-3a1]TFI10342.1 hypothetical protein E4P32_02045 [Herbaspirillum sp. 3R11]TFI16246.1 hypothetical protein E4P31_02050 [Herbaspirillum sp. 3R-11]TFI28343.1 hypothetical protein E4P30_08115 [Herbaspirillum sp. 3C11]